MHLYATYWFLVSYSFLLEGGGEVLLINDGVWYRSCMAMTKMGRYELKRLIAEGGMGEIYLAYDPLCDREVALKIIKPKLKGHESIRQRFVREAKFASRLSHPSIIPIYAIHHEGDELYYTMPYVQGETLKEIVRKTRDGVSPHGIGQSIPGLVRIFLSVCQAMDYAHANGILHRDLKPENIIVGRFGEVMILDWGLAQSLGQEDVEGEEIEGEGDFTQPGKVVGTVSFMAPERAFNHQATRRSDVYSLGIMFYQLLTLRLPFIRKSLKEFKRLMTHEVLVDPAEKAPHRDIPKKLSQIIEKCLAFHPEDRYASVHEVINELEGYIEGRPDWAKVSELSIAKNTDWEFQENVLLAKHIAITRMTEVMEWVMLMISRDSYTGNMQISTTLKLGNDCAGVGILFCVPEPSQRKGLEDGYSLWVGEEGVKLFRSNVEVMDITHFTLKSGETYQISIEKIDQSVKCTINGDQVLEYITHIPLVGGHVGMVYRDADFLMKPLTVSLGSQSVMVNCLAIPDAFLNSHDYDKALHEYRQIAHSFKGRLEGREATFRAGLTLLEQAKETHQDYLFDESVEEFSKLHATPGAPLEYLGKSIVYKARGDLAEEVKCLEFGLRRFAKHPLLNMLHEHIVFRLHETAKWDRKAAYEFALIAIRHMPDQLRYYEMQELLSALRAHWEPLYFLTPCNDPINDAIILAFWLTRPITLYEIINTIPKEHPNQSLLTQNALQALLEMGCTPFAEKIVQELPGEKLPPKLPLPYQEIWDALLVGKDASPLFDKYSADELCDITSSLHFLYGCHLYVTEGKDIGLVHLSGVVDQPYPPTYTLLSHFLSGNIDLKGTWFEKSFAYERINLYRQLILFYSMLGKKRKSASIEKRLSREYQAALHNCENML